MTAVQRRFLALLAQRMAGAPEKPIFDFVMGLAAPDLQDCLDAFMTVSAKYGIEHKSEFVYWGVAARALHMSQPYYALEFEYRSRPEANDEWSKRFARLPKDLHDEALRTIADKKRHASPVDHRRLQRFIDIEHDVAAAAKQAASTKAPTRRDPKRFLDAFHRYMTARAKTARDELDKVIEALSGRALEDALHAYLEASRRYASDDPFSLYAFFGLASRAMHWSSGYFALKFQEWVKPGTKSEWAQRYARLNPWQQRELTKDFAYANQHTRILDELRFAYYKAKGADPNDRALRDFQPLSDDTLSRAVSEVLDRYARDCDRDDVRGFQTSWDRFSKLLHGRRLVPGVAVAHDRLTLAAIVKWCRDWLLIDRELQDELYWNAVGALFAQLLRDRPQEYQHGFNDEERAYFVSPDAARHPYLDDFLTRLRHLEITRNFTDFTKMAKVHAALMIYGNKRRMRLATMRETADVFERVEAMYEHGPAEDAILTVPVTQREGLLKDRDATVSVGQTYGDITIVWFRDMETAYVACRGLDKVLFLMYETTSAHQLGELTTARFYDEVYAATEGLLELIPLFYQVLGFLPDLVTGGLAELARSAAMQYVIGRATHAVLGEGTAADITEMGLNLLAGHAATARGISGEARGLGWLEHGALETRGVHLHGDDAGVAGARLANRPAAKIEELPPVAPSERIAPPAKDISASRPPPVRPSKAGKLVEELEVGEQRELLSGGGQAAGGRRGGRRGGRKPKSEKEPESEKLGAQEQRGGGGKGRRRPAQPPDPQPRAAAPDVPLDPRKRYATHTFEVGFIQYRFEGTGASFNALKNHTNPGLFQVYEVRNAQGQVIYTGITAGKRKPRNALDRLKEHLYRKDGSFIADAASLHIVSSRQEKGPAMAVEKTIMTNERRTVWNAPERDPQDYGRKFGFGGRWRRGKYVVEEAAEPSVGEFRAAYKDIARFEIVMFPDD